MTAQNNKPPKYLSRSDNILLNKLNYHNYKQTFKNCQEPSQITFTEYKRKSNEALLTSSKNFKKPTDNLITDKDIDNFLAVQSLDKPDWLFFTPEINIKKILTDEEKDDYIKKNNTLWETTLTKYNLKNKNKYDEIFNNILTYIKKYLTDIDFEVLSSTLSNINLYFKAKMKTKKVKTDYNNNLVLLKTLCLKYKINFYDIFKVDNTNNYTFNFNYEDEYLLSLVESFKDLSIHSAKHYSNIILPYIKECITYINLAEYNKNLTNSNKIISFTNTAFKDLSYDEKTNVIKKYILDIFEENTQLDDYVKCILSDDFNAKNIKWNKRQGKITDIKDIEIIEDLIENMNLNK